MCIATLTNRYFTFVSLGVKKKQLPVVTLQIAGGINF